MVLAQQPMATVVLTSCLVSLIVRQVSQACLRGVRGQGTWGALAASTPGEDSSLEPWAGGHQSGRRGFHQELGWWPLAQVTLRCRLSLLYPRTPVPSSLMWP